MAFPNFIFGAFLALVCIQGYSKVVSIPLETNLGGLADFEISLNETNSTIETNNNLNLTFLNNISEILQGLNQSEMEAVVNLLDKLLNSTNGIVSEVVSANIGKLNAENSNYGLLIVGKGNHDLANVGIGNTGKFNVGKKYSGIFNVGIGKKGMFSIGIGTNGIGQIGVFPYILQFWPFGGEYKPGRRNGTRGGSVTIKGSF